MLATLLPLLSTMSSLQVGQLRSADLIGLASKLDQALDPGLAAKLADVLNGDSFQGSLTDWFTSGRWMHLLAGRTDQPTVSEVTVQCPHCAQPFRI